jgi:tetratricopeptide (TPR) repeat protein
LFRTLLAAVVLLALPACTSAPPEPDEVAGWVGFRGHTARLLHKKTFNLQFSELDDLEAAEKSYRRVLELNPEESTVREALARVLIRQGELGAARDEYERLREEGEISYQGLYDLGRIYVRTGQAKEGLQAIKHARRRAERGLDELEGALKRDRQELLVSMQLTIADALVVQGRYGKAREVIEQSTSEQAPALLQLLDSNPDAYRESVVTSEIY